MDIQVSSAQGQILRKIDSELCISRNTVKHHLQQQKMLTYAKRSQQLNKLALFKPYTSFAPIKNSLFLSLIQHNI